MSGASLRTVVPPWSVMMTGGIAALDCGGVTNVARQARMFGNSLTLFALTTRPVSVSINA